MAEPLDSATTLLSSASSLIKTEYRDGVTRHFTRFGKKWNRLFSNVTGTRRSMDGNRYEIKVITYNAWPTSVSRDPNGDFPSPQKFGSSVIYATFSETPASNDFGRLAAQARVTDSDLIRAGNSEGVAIDFLAETVAQFRDNFSSSLAIHRHLPASALICLVNGTPTNDAAPLVADCGAAAAGAQRFRIDGGTVAALPPGLKVDIYSGATTTKRHTHGFRVRSYNPADTTSSSQGSVGVVPLDASGNDDTSVTVTIADNDTVYFKGERDAGLESVGEWFLPWASITSTAFFGVDRTSGLNFGWMLPTDISPSAATPFSKSHLDDFAVGMSFVHEEMGDGGYVVVTTPRLDQAFRDEIDQNVLIQFPSKTDQGKLMAQYGFDGMLYRHPTLGRITFSPDPLAPPNEIKFLKPGTWECLTPFRLPTDEFRLMPGSSVGNWSRMPSSTPGAGFSTVYVMEGYTMLCDICLNPRVNGIIRNVTA